MPSSFAYPAYVLSWQMFCYILPIEGQLGISPAKIFYIFSQENAEGKEIPLHLTRRIQNESKFLPTWPEHKTVIWNTRIKEYRNTGLYHLWVISHHLTGHDLLDICQYKLYLGIFCTKFPTTVSADIEKLSSSLAVLAEYSRKKA